MIKSWSELPIGKYLEIRKIDLADDPFEAALRINAILADMTYDDVLALPLNEIAKMSKDRSFLEKKPIARITKKKYKLGGKEYLFDGRPEKITTGQFIDLNNVDKDDLAGALAIFLIPADAKGYLKGYELEDVKLDVLKYLSAEEGLSMANFFTTVFDLFQHRLEKKVRRTLKQARRQGIPTEKAEEMIRRLGKLRTYLRG